MFDTKIALLENSETIFSLMIYNNIVFVYVRFSLCLSPAITEVQIGFLSNSTYWIFTCKMI